MFSRDRWLSTEYPLSPFFSKKKKPSFLFRAAMQPAKEPYFLLPLQRKSYDWCGQWNASWNHCSLKGGEITSMSPLSFPSICFLLFLKHGYSSWSYNDCLSILRNGNCMLWLLEQKARKRLSLWLHCGAVVPALNSSLDEKNKICLSYCLSSDLQLVTDRIDQGLANHCNEPNPALCLFL